MECMIVIKNDSPRSELGSMNVEIKQVEKIHYLGSVITEDGKCDTQIWMCRRITKNAFQKLTKVLSDQRIM